MSVPLPARSRFEIREIRPDDKARLRAGYAHLSPESIRKRFLTPKPRLSSTEVRYLTEVDGHDHMALVALPEGDDRHIVAVARCVRLPEAPDTAEFAIVVGDDHQGRGLGRELAARLADLAAAHGIAHFTASVLADNAAAQRLIDHISARLTYAGASNGVREIVADLAA